MARLGYWLVDSPTFDHDCGPPDVRESQRKIDLLLPAERNQQYNLRRRSHSHVLPIVTSVNSSNFMNYTIQYKLFNVSAIYRKRIRLLIQWLSLGHTITLLNRMLLSVLLIVCYSSIYTYCSSHVVLMLLQQWFAC